jgi:hypothetical protein
MRSMFDSDELEAIPINAPMVAAYANGRYQNFERAQVRWPTATVVAISVLGNGPEDLAHVLDIEKGAATASEFEAWADAMRAKHVRRPTAYVALSNAEAVVRAVRGAVKPDLWVADWTGAPHRLEVPGANVVAVQYCSPGTGSHGHYDVSAVWDDTWHPYERRRTPSAQA